MTTISPRRNQLRAAAPLIAALSLLACSFSQVATYAAPGIPPASGVLFDPANPADLAGINKKTFTVTIIDDAGVKALQASTDAASGWPDFDLPAPADGWNLAAYGGVKFDVTNTGTTEATVGLRIDNAGDSASRPWNTELVKLAPGQTKPLSVSFGVSYHQRGFVLDAANIVRLKVFLSSPKPTTVLVIKNVKAFPKSEALTPPAPKPPAPVDPNAISLPGFSKGGDRDVAVVPAAWVGKKPPVDGDWVQTFNDDFNGTTLDEKLWNNKPFGNGVQTQLQHYSKQNAVVENGFLKQIAEKRPGFFNADPKMAPKAYASNYIDTFGKWKQQYGYFEARIKLPTARGLWPAFWMMPDRGESFERHERSTTRNDGMEFDIMEQLAEWGPGRYNIATHWDDYGADHKHWGNSSTYYGPTADNFHNFGMLWEPGKLTFYVDGIKKAEQISDRIGTAPEHFILNIQIGGWATTDVDDSKLPDAMVVDYVRAWQLKSRMTK
ncbi:MAG TPA: glycoside hydrolase family 16 protein [Capsulimonadaceae bacterium]|jgi:beta-glucanase (GH16 family)